MQLQLAVAKQEYEASVARYDTIRIIALTSIIGGVLFAVLFGLLLIRGISRSLSQAMSAQLERNLDRRNASKLCFSSTELPQLLSDRSPCPPHGHCSWSRRLV